jgi:hypothetical protein
MLVLALSIDTSHGSVAAAVSVDTQGLACLGGSDRAPRCVNSAPKNRVHLYVHTTGTTKTRTAQVDIVNNVSCMIMRTGQSWPSRCCSTSQGSVACFRCQWTLRPIACSGRRRQGSVGASTAVFRQLNTNRTPIERHQKRTRCSLAKINNPSRCLL